MKAKNFKIMSFTIAGALVAVMIAVTIACGLLSSLITSMLSLTKLDSAARERGEKLAEQIVEEGVTLTRNENNVLPLDPQADNKVNVFGWAGAHWLAGGSGSGRNVSGSGGISDKFFPETDLLKGLKNFGVDYNTELIDMYKAFQDGYPNTGSDEQKPNNPMLTDTLHTHDYESCRLFEPRLSDTAYYTDALLNNAENYSSTAFVVISRLSGESNDAPPVQYKNYTKRGLVPAANTDETRTYLDISTEEEELLTYVGETYDKVIVLVNSTNAMNLGFTERISGIDACIVAGGTGLNAVSGLINVIYGKTSPSGRLTDTYVYDFSTAAVHANSGKTGVGIYTNSSGVYPTTTTNPNVGSENNRYSGASYLDYAEGIYVGYRWYETADAEKFWDGSFAESRWNIRNGYSDVVQYPFGYGLSYTDFECNITDVSPKASSTLKRDDKITITVRVHNTGDTAGKHVVQLYAAAPYTGKIEKSAVSLAAFAKTPVDVEPDGYQDLTLELDAFDLASYDYDGAFLDDGGYVLEKGAYQLRLMKNSHETEDMPVGANAIVTYNVDRDLTFTVDAESEKDIHNIFTGNKAIDGFSVDGKTSGEGIKYMTRADFEGTFPERTPDREMSAALKAAVMYLPADARDWEARHADVAAPEQGVKGDLRAFDGGRTATELGLKLGEDYEHPQWKDLLDQITERELDSLVLHGFLHEEAISSIGKDRTSSVDGPTQVGSFNVNEHGTGFPNTTVLAQTFNPELARSFGLALGAEAQGMSVSGLYAPGMNLHRSAFGGRNYEYFSEDPVLTGIMAANVARGSLQTGTYMYAKHIIGYDQESYRDGMYCWMTEQTLREIYLRPFKIAIDKGGLSGLMTSYGRIGAVWSGGSEALLTELLRDEWNFKGAVITDYSDHQDFMNGDQMIRAGGDLWMDGYKNNGSFRKDYTSDSGAFLAQQRKAAKHILYMMLNAQYVNSTYDATADGINIVRAEGNGSWWIALLAVGDILLVGGAATLVVFGIRKKDKPVATEQC